jgi:hypothetical protein
LYLVYQRLTPLVTQAPSLDGAKPEPVEE